MRCVSRKTASAWLGVKGVFFGRFFADVKAGLRDVDNFAHIEGDHRRIPFVSLRVSSFFSTLVDIN